jgi:hypothetical protein
MNGVCNGWITLSATIVKCIVMMKRQSGHMGKKLGLAEDYLGGGTGKKLGRAAG